MKVSFDFDETLEYQYVQDYARELIERGIDVHIVTSRFGDNDKYQKFFHTNTNVDITNVDLWKISKNLGIPDDNVHFTNMTPKWNFFENHRDFIWHLDDNTIENIDINEYTKIKGIDVLNNQHWRRKCDDLLNNKEDF